jgi:hypothetical protein
MMLVVWFGAGCLGGLLFFKSVGVIPSGLLFAALGLAITLVMVYQARQRVDR